MTEDKCKSVRDLAIWGKFGTYCGMCKEKAWHDFRLDNLSTIERLAMERKLV